MTKGEAIAKLKSGKLFLFITATEIETEMLLETFKPLDEADKVLELPIGKHSYTLGKFGKYEAVHVQCDDTGTATAGGAMSTAMNAIDVWNPDAVVMVGIAFGKDQRKQNIGDGLLSKTVVQYEKVKYENGKEEFRGNKVEVGQLLFNRFNNLRSWNYEHAIPSGKDEKERETVTAQKISAVLLCGEKLIDDRSEKAKLFAAFPDADGGDMESFGIYSACRDKDITEWIIIKGICDFAENKGKNKEEKQRIAAAAAVSLCLTGFEEENVFDDLKINPNISLKKARRRKGGEGEAKVQHY